MAVNVITDQVASVCLARLIPTVQPEKAVVTRCVFLAQVVSVSTVRLFQIVLPEKAVV